jgi:hypothetical protein
MHALEGNEAHPNALPPLQSVEYPQPTKQLSNPTSTTQANQATHSIPNVSSNFPVSTTESHQIQAPKLAKFQSPNSAHILQ